MRIAFYLDCHDSLQVSCMETAIRCAREHMNCEIVHLTLPDGPKFDVTRVEKDVSGPFGYRRTTLSAELDGEVLFLGADVLCNADVSGIFKQEFDVAIATDMKPGHPDIKYNTDVIFCRNPKFWLDLRDRVGEMGFGWYPLEKALTDLIDSGKYNVLVLPGEEYNYVPEFKEDRQGKLTHYRGNRKAWIPHPLEYTSRLNTPEYQMLGNLATNLLRGLPIFAESQAHDRTASIVGGGPSLADNLEKLHGDVFALNGAYGYLLDQGIEPAYQVLLDARAENIRFVCPNPGTKYLIAGVCHPSVFEALRDCSVTLWVPDMGGIEHMSVLRVGGGATVGMKAMYLAYLMGYRKMEFFGFDSSYTDKHHAYDQPMNDGEDVIDVVAAGRTFRCAPWMAKQATEFQKQSRKLVDLGCQITVHGYGLIPWITYIQSGGSNASDGRTPPLREVRAAGSR